jgi:WhiB family redox-sensing transcriptional regulator
VQNQDWVEFAACRDEDPELWFPGKEEVFYGPADARIAIDICNSCPVRDECLTEAIRLTSKGPLYGIWGGLPDWEISKLAGRRSSHHIWRGTRAGRK